MDPSLGVLSRIPTHLEHGPRVLGVRRAVPDVAGAQAARHQVPRPLEQPPPFDIHPVLFVPDRSGPAHFNSVETPNIYCQKSIGT